MKEKSSRTIVIPLPSVSIQKPEEIIQNARFKLMALGIPITKESLKDYIKNNIKDYYKINK